MKILSLIFLAFFYTISAQNVAPACKLCKCEEIINNKIHAMCTQNLGGQLFLTSFWKNEPLNTSYPYEELTIENTPILTLDQPFPKSPIKYFNLAKNSIVNISDNIFANLQDMETLILGYNNIEFLHPNAFKGIYLQGDDLPLKSLRILNLEHNRIHTLDADIFEHAGRIEDLSLAHNPIKTIDLHTHQAITSLVNLKYLDLSYTELSSLPETFLHTPMYLSTLYLSGNQFTSIPKTLHDTHNLSTLYIDNNPFVNLTKENGFPVTKLRILHMRHMDLLKNISAGALSGLKNLEELYITDNIALTFIHEEAISSRNNDSYKSKIWPPIKKLHLQSNKLAYLDMQIIVNWNSLVDLDMSNNPWTCECENQWMIDELMPTYLKIDAFKAKDLQCAAPIEMVGTSFFDIYSKKSTMRCLDLYGHHPERDGTLLIGLLAGILITIPLVLFMIYSYQRNWFGLFDSSAASFSRQFYKRTQSTEDAVF